MSSSRLLLPSFALNALLTLLLAWLWRPLPRPDPDLPAPAAARTPPTSGPALSLDKAPELAPAAELRWWQFSVTQWSRYRDELLAAGVPRRNVRDIVAPLVRRFHEARAESLVASVAGSFWELVAASGDGELRQFLGQIFALERETEADLRRLFPDGWLEVESSSPDIEADRLDFLAPDQAERVRAAQRRLVNRLAAASAGPDEGREEVSAAMADFAADIATLLTPEEQAELQDRLSDYARWLRGLEGIELSSAEVRELTRQRERVPGGLTAESVRELLGPARAAQFARAKEPGYQALRALARRANLPAGAAESLWEAQAQFARAAAAVGDDTALGPAGQQSQLAELRRQQEEWGARLMADSPGAFEAWQRQQKAWLEETFGQVRINPVADWLDSP